MVLKKILPALIVMGRKILHTGELGSATVLKVITNYLASTHLVALGEAWTVAKKSNLNLSKVYKGIAVSSWKFICSRNRKSSNFKWFL